MPFNEILGQDYAIGIIKKALKKNRMPQAWLFTGQSNIGKFKTAVALSQKLNCRKFADDACGKCDYCVQIENQNFMDFRVIAPDVKNIKINQIIKSLDWLNLHSDRAKTRVMVIDEAQKLGREAANAFLKTLEEPSPNTLLILIAESSKQIPDTVVSRCQQIRFRSLSNKAINQILQEKKTISNDKINFVSSFCIGSIKTNITSKIELIKTVQEIVIFWMINISSINFYEVLKNCEKWGKSKDEEFIILLDFLEIWFRDLAFFMRGIPEQNLINYFDSNDENRISSLRKCALYFKINDVQEIFWKIIEARKLIEMNANRSLIISSLFFYIYRKSS